MNIKILFFLITHAFPQHVFRPKKDAKEITVYFSFMTIMLTLFTLGVTLIGRSKLPQVRLKLLQVQSKLPHLIQWGNFGRTLIQNIVKKINHHLWKRYRT